MRTVPCAACALRSTARYPRPRRALFNSWLLGDDASCRSCRRASRPGSASNSGAEMTVMAIVKPVLVPRLATVTVGSQSTIFLPIVHYLSLFVLCKAIPRYLFNKTSTSNLPRTTCQAHVVRLATTRMLRRGRGPPMHTRVRQKT